MGPSVQQLLIVLAIIILIFGAKKIPELAKGLGSGIKNFKKAVKEEDENTELAQTNKIEGNVTAQNQNMQQSHQPPVHNNMSHLSSQSVQPQQHTTPPSNSTQS